LAAVAMVMHDSEMNNPNPVCIREGSSIIGSAVGNYKGVKGNHKEWVYCARVVQCMLPMNQGEPDE
jgi:hypothetical protein